MKFLKLNDGNKIPQLGFGTYKIADLDECERCVLDALNAGYRMIDTAQAYGNETAVGKAIIKSGIPRNELFITTKVSFRNFENPEESIERSLKRLQLDYIDLVLIHWPYGNYYNCWRALEKYQKLGKIRSIGVSNFGTARFIDLVNFNKVIPAVNQIETNVLCQRKSEKEWLDKYGTLIEAYGPLGQGKRDEVLSNPTVVSLAQKYTKTPAQIVLRFLIQLGYIVIPKSTHKERIEENINIFDFELNKNDMDALSQIDEDKPLGGNSEIPERADLLTGDSHPIFGKNAKE